MESKDPSYFGTLVFEKPKTLGLAPSGYSGEQVSATCEHGKWHPPQRLAEFLPEGFSLEIDCYTTADGFRRILPRYNFEELINMGAVGGLAVIHGLRGFDKQVDHSYRTMFLIHEHVRGRAYRNTRGMTEHLTRNFDYSRDLYVRRLGRETDGVCNVLPDDATLDTRREEKPLTVKKLTATGRQKAQASGFHKPDSRQAIALGFFEAATLKPLDVAIEKVPDLVRMVLFSMDHIDNSTSEELIKTVTERLLDAVHGHLDDTQEDFHNWFFGPSNSLVKQIAKQKKKHGGVLKREDVRQALLHLGWQAYEYVGQCVHALMHTIKNSMPQPFNEKEKRLFEHMYERQACYGNLPLVLLFERMDFLRPAILAIWDEPQKQIHIRVLHRMMWYYAAMASKRREADRLSKQRIQNYTPTMIDEVCQSDQPTVKDADPNINEKSPTVGQHALSKHYAGSTSLIANLHSSLNINDDQFKEIMEYICEINGIECANRCIYWDYRPRDETDESLILEVRCECGDVNEEISITFENMKKYREELLE